MNGRARNHAAGHLLHAREPRALEERPLARNWDSQQRGVFGACEVRVLDHPVAAIASVTGLRGAERNGHSELPVHLVNLLRRLCVPLSSSALIDGRCGARSAVFVGQ
ncbi:hypothetical protein MRX96_012977 [Rhipicephalus microplus]